MPSPLMIMLIVYLIMLPISSSILYGAARWANADDLKFSRALLYTALVSGAVLLINLLFSINLSLLGSIVFALGAIPLFKIKSEMLVVFIGTLITLNIAARFVIIAILQNIL